VGCRARATTRWQAWLWERNDSGGRRVTKRCVVAAALRSAAAEEVAGDHDALDLGSAFADPEELRVAHELLVIDII
jgi:hypothetical protein